MPYTFKTNELSKLPRTDEELTLTSNHNHVVGEFAQSDPVFVFVENGSILGAVGGMVARGMLVDATPVEKSVRLTIRFDGVKVSAPLSLKNLDRFAHPKKYHLPERDNPALRGVFSILQDVAEIRRNTTGQPVHALSEDAADWLNLYHFEKERS
ncbi:hypothetical protein Ga0609869_001591 [Rhodovulum iodosum]|uniref:Uncharacterized protein n=1 Tax=Rhodovulum iodosum TaxID=68291 RepID=A0ABV3XSE7_9RHOB|nr:hypothetical protein [Rhodovulum robiginosum]RSK30561.1 hypothetical protein EJA01_17495 [Rhodovulum robiginosum]